MHLRLALMALLLGVAGVAFAQAPSDATGQCKDGSYTSAAAKRGACRGHGGVKDWYSKTAAKDESAAKSESRTSKSNAKSSTREESAATGGGNAMSESGSMSKSRASRAKTESMKSEETPRATAAAGGGAGKVWVNTRSKVYHCEGDRWYGKTKEGEYLSESQAKQQGFHAAAGKQCSS